MEVVRARGVIRKLGPSSTRWGPVGTLDASGQSRVRGVIRRLTQQRPMAIRVAVAIESGEEGCVLRTSALANAGFESDEPVCSIPVKAAIRLGWWPDLPASARVYSYRAYSGDAVVYHLDDAVRVRILVGDRERQPVRASAVITPTDDEVVLNDVLMGRLGIVLVDTERGTWCFRDEPIEPGRPSERPESW